ncbi:MAG: tRNA lysidine(34) synthetase TilS [Treponema sp.]|nr:tRNA lysidine(34) synthetase TilS [Treponema sp.]
MQIENNRAVFENAVASALTNCQAGAAFLAAVSGGADSTAMLAALCAVMRNSAKGAFSLACLHVEHGIRPAGESRGDAEFVVELCRSLGVSCKVVSVPPGKIAAAAGRGIGIEAAARQFRRRALFREARRMEREGGGQVRILTGHTKDDLLETALMRVLRGAGPEGLAAMPASRGRILRPILTLSRADVLEYLTERKISWREDASNSDSCFLRNRIRNSLIPMLNKDFPFWNSGLFNMAATQSRVSGFIKDEAARRVKWEQSPPPNHDLTTNAETFFAQPPIVREEALFAGIDLLLAGKENPATIKRSVVRRFCDGLITAADLGPLTARLENELLSLTIKRAHPFERGFSLLIKEPGFYNLSNISVEVRILTARERPMGGFSAALPLVLRRSFKDDFLVSSGRKIAPVDIVSTQRQEIISAVDRLGTAAFLGSGKLLFWRELEPGRAEGQLLYYVLIKNTGGMNV